MYFFKLQYLKKKYYIKLSSGADPKLALAYNRATCHLWAHNSTIIREQIIHRK